MAGNEQIFDSIVDPSANKQVQALTTDLAALDAQAVDTARSINILNTATANSKTFSDLQKNSAATETAQKKAQDSLEKTRLAEIRLQQQREKNIDSFNKQNSAFAQLNKQYQLAIQNAKDIGAAQGTTSKAFQEASLAANALGKQVDKINTPLGDFKNKVGGYAGAIVDTFGKAFGVVRQLAYILPGIGIAGILNLAIEPISKFISGLDLFSVALDNLKLKAQSVQQALFGPEYSKAIESVTQLSVDLDLAKQGFVDKDHVIDEYNKSIGEVTGRVDTLDEAEKGLTAHSGDFIRATLLKAAAQNILAEAAKNATETAKENAVQQAEIEDLSKNGSDFGKAFGIDVANQTITKNNAELKKKTDVSIDIIKQFDKQIAAISIRNGQKSGGISDIATLQNKIANQAAQEQQQAAQALIGNDKLSYATRIKAAQDFADASRKIEHNNLTLALSDTKLSAKEKQAIIEDANLKIKQINQDAIDKDRDLRDKAAAQDLQHLKNNLQAQKDANKLIIDDPSVGTDAKLEALDKYRDASSAIINATFTEQIKAAGKNGKAITLAQDETIKEGLALEQDYQTQYNKILQDGYNQQIAGAKKHDADLLDNIKQAGEVRVQAITANAQKELDALDANFKGGGLNTHIYEAQRQAIINKSEDDILKIRIATAKKTVDLLTQAGQDAGQEQKRLSDLETTQFKTTEQRKTEVLKQEIALRDQLTQSEVGLRMQAEQTVLDTIKSIGDANYENQIEQSQKRSDLIQTQADQDKANIDGSLLSAKDKADKDKIIDAKATKDKEAQSVAQGKIREQEAKFNKEVSLLNVLVSTAEAVGKIELQAAILAANPLTLPLVPLALAQIPIAIASGAIQEAAILATPLPKYAKGTKNYPGGLGVWGEAGSELATLPSGDQIVSKGTAIANFPKGTKITPHLELMQMLKPEFIPTRDREEIGWKEVVAAIRDNKPAKNRGIKVVVDYRQAEIRKSYFK